MISHLTEPNVAPQATRHALGGSTALICRDSVHHQLLDELGDHLRDQSVDVIRGPQAPRGGRVNIDPSELGVNLAQAELLVLTIRHHCGRDALLSAPRLKGICFPTAGVESLDIDVASELGILVGHGATPENWIGMAEATVLLLLGLLYNLHSAERVLRERLPLAQHKRAKQLSGKTVGLIGFGRIARAVASRLQAFDARLLAYSPRTKPETVPSDVVLTDLETLLRSSDVVLVMVSINPESIGLLNWERLCLMKQSAYLVNTARGKVVDEAALVKVLRDGRIAGAALDTFAIEPLPVDSPLRQLDNVILTPHIIGHTHEAAQSLKSALINNARNILQNEPPVYCLNSEAVERWNRRLTQTGSGNKRGQ